MQIFGPIPPPELKIEFTLGVGGLSITIDNEGGVGDAPAESGQGPASNTPAPNSSFPNAANHQSPAAGIYPPVGALTPLAARRTVPHAHVGKRGTDGRMGTAVAARSRRPLPPSVATPRAVLGGSRGARC